MTFWQEKRRGNVVPFLLYTEYELPNPLMGVLDNYFPTGTFTGIGTSVLSLKHAIKSTTKKKIIQMSSEL